MTWAGRSRSRSLARPVSARTRRTSSSGNVLAITPRLMWSLTRMPAGRPAGARAIAVARPRARARMDQLQPYVNGIGTRRVLSLLAGGPSRRGVGPVRGDKGLKPNDFNGPSGGAGETRGENRYREENTGHGAPFSYTHITIPPDS